MDREHVLAVAPHYVVMVILLLVAFNVVRVVLGEANFWVEMAVALVIVFAYRPVVVSLGVGPDVWE